jgi:membrane associated rhomboid family serine protease
MGLADRHYMRDDSGIGRFGPLTSLPAWLVILILNVMVFVAQNAGGLNIYSSFLEYGALSTGGLKRGFIWQFLTYQFMHGTFGHLLLNSLCLYFFGRPLESMLGKRIFLSLYLLSGFVGGIVQILLGLFSEQFAGPTVGASAGLCGLVAAFALLNPRSTIYLFFILPIRAIYFLPLMTVATILFILIPSHDNIAHGAHLGGILAGVTWVKLGWHRDFVQLPWAGLFERLRRWKPLKSRRRKRELVRAASLRGRTWRQATAETEPELPPEEFISKEVDPILDKISAHGIQSLTERERKILEAARKRMAKR